LLIAAIFSGLASMPCSFEHNVEVVYQITSLFGFDYDIIDVSLDGWSNVFPKNVLHAPLIRSPCVPETEGHSNIAIHAEWGDERSRELVGLLHFDLVVAGIRI
jgi:hypothetical protein